MTNKDIVACWDIPLADKVHRIEFEHGTTSGKRVIYVDGKEIKRDDWMFKLVGKEHFDVGTTKCCISIEAVSGFAYEYTLEINGKSLKKFVENQVKMQHAWLFMRNGIKVRICLDKQTLDVYVDGQKKETYNDFGEDDDNSTNINFTLNDGTPAYIKSVSSGNKRQGIIHSLYVDENFVPEVFEFQKFC